jgi:hypothetical protein
VIFIESAAAGTPAEVRGAFAGLHNDPDRHVPARTRVGKRFARKVQVKVHVYTKC